MTEPRRRATRRSPAPRAARPDAVDARLDELDARVAEIEEQKDLRTRGRNVMESFVPPEASRHFRTSTREQLLGVRALVDFWIRRLDAHEAQGSAPSRPSREEPERIEIE